jgi:hydroxyacylglutathione hydrolase
MMESMTLDIAWPENGLIVEHFPVGQLACTCTILADRQSGEAIIIDGGADVPRIMARLAQLKMRVTRLLHTHAHIDHIGAMTELREQCGGLAALHPADLPLSRTLARQAQWLGLAPLPIPTFDDEINDGDTLSVGRFRVEVLHTPGHTPGSVCFSVTYGAENLLLTGDTLFAGGVGRWDLGGTSLEDIVKSIRTKLLIYPNPTTVIPGHGAYTTIGHERTSNPFLIS